MSGAVIAAFDYSTADQINNNSIWRCYKQHNHSIETGLKQIEYHSHAQHVALVLKEMTRSQSV
jgi:hypothetical protein